MRNKVQRLKNDIMFVQKFGDQTEDLMILLYAQIHACTRKLRKEGKPVLFLSDAREEGDMTDGAKEIALTIGKQLDYDKSATFGASATLLATREELIKIAKLNDKVRSFKTRKEAIDWLLS